MRLHYMGKYNLDPDSLPHGSHQPGAVKFKEPEDSKKLAAVANGIAIGVLVAGLAILVVRAGSGLMEADSLLCLVAMALSIVCALPHEMLHAICFKEDVYLYTNLKQGMLFVVGPEIMSKSRFIVMSLLPAIVLGFVPVALFLANPAWVPLGLFGAFSASMAGGDFLNVFNAATQMPKGVKTYLYGFNSYWFLP